MREPLSGAAFWAMLEETSRRVDGWPQWKSGIYSPEDVRDRTMSIICDFCSARHAPWVYEADDFVLWVAGDFGGRSCGNWAACNTCHDLIESGNKEGLLRQMYESLLHSEPMFNTLTDEHLASIKDQMRETIEQFNKHRKASSSPYKE